MARLTGVLGILAILLFCFLFSTDRKAIRPRTILVGLVLQFVFAVLVLRVSFGVRVMTAAGDAVDKLLSYSFAGSQFVFGEFGAKMSKFGVVFAFQVLPIIIFIAAFFAILYYYGVMQFIIRQTGEGDDALDGRQRRRVAQCRCLNLHGHHRSAADDSSVPA